MGLHDRLRSGEGRHARPRAGSRRRQLVAPSPLTRRSVRRAEGGGAPRVHREARARALQGGRRGSQRPRLQGGHRGARARRHAADARGAARARPPADRRHPRLRPARAAAPRRHRDRVMVNGAGHGLRRARRQARAHRRPLRRRRAPDAHHRQDRLAGRPPRRRGVADGRRAPARRQPRQRDHPAARARRARR